MATMRRPCFVLSLLCLVSPSMPQALPARRSRYCIVGAGPAGIQLGHFLNQNQRDYVITTVVC